MTRRENWQRSHASLRNCHVVLHTIPLIQGLVVVHLELERDMLLVYGHGLGIERERDDSRGMPAQAAQANHNPRSDNIRLRYVSCLRIQVHSAFDSF